MVNISFEKKILIYFLVSIVVGFSIINFISILFLQKLIQNHFEYTIKLYITYPEKNLPNYIRLSDRPFLKGYEVLGKKHNKFLLIKKEKLYHLTKKPVIQFAVLLFLWEVSFISILMLILYKTLYSYAKLQQNHKNFFELFTLSFTHKLGNFLFSQKVNVEILDKKYKDNAIQRLRNNYNVMEEEFKNSLNLLKNISLDNQQEDIVDIKYIIQNTINQQKVIYPNTKIFVSGESKKIKANIYELKTLINLIIENAFKYGNNIKVRICKNGILVSNDITEIKKQSTGIGLELVKFLTEKNKWKVIFQIKGRFYIIIKF